jgi:hypothetical protein
LEEISASAAARHLGLTNQALGQWCIKPGAPVRKDGRKVWVRWPDFARWREKELAAQAKKEGEQNEFFKRKLAAEARAAEIAVERGELALARERGESMAIEDYEKALGIILDRLTARIRAMPVRLSHLGPEVEAAAEEEAERMVNELNGWDEDVLAEPGKEEAA